MIKNCTSKLLWHFDRTFGNSKKWFRQLIWLFSIIFITILVFSLIGQLLFENFPDSQNQKLNIFQHTIGMILKSNGIQIDNSRLPFAWQVILVFAGSFLFSGFVITYLGNLLRNRLEAYRNGSVRYQFNNHILFLGGSKMILPMIKELYKQEKYQHLDFVILTEAEAREIRGQIDSVLSEEERKRLKTTVLRGYRDDKENLESVYIDKAARIYIIGENPNNSEHDSTNMACWNITKELCAERTSLPCFLMFNRASSAFIFRRMDTKTSSCLDTTIVNRLESVAQRVLIHNGNEINNFPALDREKGIGKDSKRTVHFVLYGMTAISYALSTTAAHLCHFPNFIAQDSDGKYIENKERRTRITLITPNIKEEMAYLTAHLHNLFSLSKVNFIDRNREKKEDIYNIASADNPYGDFLDIEWDFVDGNIADQRIRDLLLSFYEQNQKGETYLTLAMCQHEADKNIAAALYLPSEFHDIYYKDHDNYNVDFERTIPILVYQPENEEMIKTANQTIPILKNIFPFGSVKESYDPAIRNRIEEGKRICYIYKQNDDYTFMTSNQDELDDIWRKESYINQMSNIYSASHIGVKLRSVDNREQLTDEDIQLLAITEHNRWNVEKLLMGFEALPKTEREKQKDPEELNHLEDLKTNRFKHYCIEPYQELLPKDKKADTLIAKNLRDIITQPPAQNQ